MSDISGRGRNEHMKEYWKYRLAPFRLSDELYHVGTKNGPSYLLDTRDGIVLIDTGYPQTLYLLLENIRALGFDPYGIRHIIHTHGHIDHMGGTRALVELTGAVTYIGSGDEDAAAGRNELHAAREVNCVYEEPFEPDVIIHDGDVLGFGQTEISFMSTPGHTLGTLSVFFDVHIDSKAYRAGMFGGAGLNTLTDEYLTEYGLKRDMRNMYLQSIERLLAQHVEFHIGNHLWDNQSLDKVRDTGNGENPFLAHNTYYEFLKYKKEKATELFNKNQWKEGEQQ